MTGVLELEAQVKQQSAQLEQFHSRVRSQLHPSCLV
jgi:hypothetical protein